MRKSNSAQKAILRKARKDTSDTYGVRAAGAEGLLPRGIHARVAKCGLKYHHVTRRINRMNKQMLDEIGERVADKVGAKWALSDFMRRNWIAKTKEIRTEM
jgi:hypothetical protein